MPDVPTDRSSIIQYPCPFLIKVIGYNRPEFRPAVLAMVQAYAPEVVDQDIKPRLSADQNYLALSITLTALSREQLDNIYRALSGHEWVLMAL